MLFFVLLEFLWLVCEILFCKSKKYSASIGKSTYKKVRQKLISKSKQKITITYLIIFVLWDYNMICFEITYTFTHNMSMLILYLFTGSQCIWFWLFLFYCIWKKWDYLYIFCHMKGIYILPPLFNYRTFEKMTCKRLLKYIIFKYHWKALIERNMATCLIFSKTQNSEN